MMNELKKYQKILTRRKLSVLCLQSDVFACGYYRVNWPYSKIKDKFIDFHVWDIVAKPEIPFMNFVLYDAVLIQRPILATHSLLVKELRSRGVLVVIENDDRLDMVHRSNPAFNVFHNGSDALGVFLDCVANADALTVSTPELEAATLLRVHSKNRSLKTCVIPNAIDPAMPVYAKLPKREELNDGMVNVIWGGSSSHFDSLNVLKGVLEHSLNKHDNARLVICGNKEFLDIFDLPENKKMHIPGVPFLEYAGLPSYGHIALAPLVPSPFNDSKSELKILESGIWKIPTICTDVAPYRRFASKVENSTIVIKRNKSIDWIKSIDRLVTNESLRNEIGNNAYKNVIENYSLDETNKLRVKFWYDLFELN